MQNVIIIIAFLIFLCCIVCLMNEDAEKPTFSISADGSVKAENDMMRSEITIESSLLDGPDTSYQAVLPQVEKVKELLKSDLIRNVKIQPRTEPEYSYDKENNRKLKGYRTVVRVSYDSRVTDSETQEVASKLQGQIMGLSNSKSKIRIEGISYYMSDRKRVELESEALQNAILRGKAQARVMVRTTYPGSDFRVMDISTGYSGIAHEAVTLQAARGKSRNVVSQGESTISASVNMKVEVV